MATRPKGKTSSSGTGCDAAEPPSPEPPPHQDHEPVADDTRVERPPRRDTPDDPPGGEHEDRGGPRDESVDPDRLDARDRRQSTRRKAPGPDRRGRIEDDDVVITTPGRTRRADAADEDSADSGPPSVPPTEPA